MYNILVVDDDREIVKAIEIYLKREGYNVIKAYDGNEALNQVKENEIHLIILDVMMPKKDGMQTLEELRKKNSIPVIMLSAKSEDYDKISGLELGADDYITKPFNPLELVARVKSNIRRYVTLGSIKAEENNNTEAGQSQEVDSEPQAIASYAKAKINAAYDYKVEKYYTLLNDLQTIISNLNNDN